MRRSLLALALVVTGCAEKKADFKPLPPEDSKADKIPVERPVAPK